MAVDAVSFFSSLTLRRHVSAWVRKRDKYVFKDVRWHDSLLATCLGVVICATICQLEQGCEQSTILPVEPSAVALDSSDRVTDFDADAVPLMCIRPVQVTRSTLLFTTFYYYLNRSAALENAYARALLTPRNRPPTVVAGREEFNLLLLFTSPRCKSLPDLQSNAQTLRFLYSRPLLFSRAHTRLEMTTHSLDNRPQRSRTQTDYCHLKEVRLFISLSSATNPDTCLVVKHNFPPTISQCGRVSSAAYGESGKNTEDWLDRLVTRDTGKCEKGSNMATDRDHHDTVCTRTFLVQDSQKDGLLIVKLQVRRKMALSLT
ncbi:hypothetical protein KC357_g48 [Hortaea werneckii]|nr:hypothetical protein KC357_g48 [Hortaea werneckii]